MNCEFELTPDGKYRCRFCNQVVPSQGKMNCPAQAIQQQKPELSPPSMIQRAKNLGKAVFNHATTGMNHCTPEQRKKRYDICANNKCGLFMSSPNSKGLGVCTHESCGCIIRMQGEFLDKLSWAESECPVGLWGKAEPESPENPENGV